MTLPWSLPGRRIGIPTGRSGAPAGRDRGATPVELAILLPMVLFLLIMSIQAAAYFLARTVAFTAAEEAVERARTYQGGTAAQGEQVALDYARTAPGWLTGPQAHVDKTGTEVTARVEGHVLRLLPGIDIRVAQTAHGPVERITTGG
ncbi:TadE/TadG family type IV pilus assembly protein [Plantactinospora siamensis]|uniref:TadE/TadG family type IV pilus assembly protein n=1 Tax=Plantactinospora siamensis TaxID=555372 RepID=A0ABV6NRE3_9ACTN